MESFKDRLAHILRSKNLTGTQFAGLMGIQPSNVSHLLSGRNNPSLDFLIKLKDTFPEYSFDWIIMGKKPITMVDSNTANDSPKEQIQAKQLNIDITEDEAKEEIETSTPIEENVNNARFHIDNKEDMYVRNNPCHHNDNPQKIIVVYEDNTFEMFRFRK